MHHTIPHIASRLLPLALALSVAACGANNSNDPDATDNNDIVEPPGELVMSSVERELSPNVSPDDAETLADDNRAFAFDLYDVLRDEAPDENLFYSPHSISIALAMTYAGAEGQTATEMADALNFTLPQDDLHPAFNALDLELAARGEEDVEEGDPFELSVVNAIWGQEDYTFLPTFLDTLARNYGAGLRVLDFMNEPEASRERINQWVEDQTRERIKDLLPQGSIDPGVRLVLTNAIYFNAGWLYPFDEDNTTTADFHRLDGTTTDVDMMGLSEELPYAEVDGHQVVELPYVGDKVSMVVILPADGEFESFEDDLDADRFDELTDALQTVSGTLRMPRFEYESSFQLNEAMKALGMEIPFTGAADFSGMTGSPDLYISDIFHKAFVKVDEEGTEAAAATAVVMGETSAPIDTFDMTVDRPFLFVIRDKPTGTVLFVGRVLDID